MSLKLYWLKKSFSTRSKEHFRNTERCAKVSNAAKHAWTFGYVINFDNSMIIDKEDNCTRKTLPGIIAHGQNC